MAERNTIQGTHSLYVPFFLGKQTVYMVDVLIAEDGVPINTQQLDFFSEYLPDHMPDRARKFIRCQGFSAYLTGKFILVEGWKKYGSRRKY